MRFHNFLLHQSKQDTLQWIVQEHDRELSVWKLWIRITRTYQCQGRQMFRIYAACCGRHRNSRKINRADFEVAKDDRAYILEVYRCTQRQLGHNCYTYTIILSYWREAKVETGIVREPGTEMWRYSYWKWSKQYQK